MKTRYSLTPDNRLTIKRSKSKKSLTVNGRFSSNKKNELIYLVNEPLAWRREYDVPHKIRLRGKWRLDKSHDLEFVTEEPKDKSDWGVLLLRGRLIAAEADSFVFEMRSAVRGTRRGQAVIGTSIYLLKLEGKWQADEFNRLAFLVKKDAAPDTLTLQASWQVNKDQQIIYTYEKRQLKRRSGVKQTVAFDGFWEIGSSNRLTYRFLRGSNSRFDFRAQVETPDLYPRDGLIKYRLGAGVREIARPRVRVISLYGAWKLNRQLGLSFEMEYAKGKFRSLEFSAEAAASASGKITFSLRTAAGEPLGLCITFTRKFLRQNNAEAFLRLKAALDKEYGVEAGVMVPF